MYVMTERGFVTEGEVSDACLIRRDAHDGTFMSRHIIELLSTSGGSFFVKLMPLKMLYHVDAPLDEIPGDWSEALLLRLLLNVHVSGVYTGINLNDIWFVYIEGKEKLRENRIGAAKPGSGQGRLFWFTRIIIFLHNATNRLTTSKDHASDSDPRLTFGCDSPIHWPVLDITFAVIINAFIQSKTDATSQID
ncbi:hypothetical protein Tco_1530628 [Tanacetum coccineum]